MTASKERVEFSEAARTIRNKLGWNEELALHLPSDPGSLIADIRSESHTFSQSIEQRPVFKLRTSSRSMFEMANSKVNSEKVTAQVKKKEEAKESRRKVC